MSAAKLHVTVIGAGGLSRAIAGALVRSGRAAVTVATRAKVAPVRGARMARIDGAVTAARLVLFAVPDRSVLPLAKALAPARPSWRGVVALHAAGAYGPELLAPLRARGAATGVLHPLAALGGDAAALAGAFARIEGAPAAQAAARRLCALCGLTPFRGARVETALARRRYHAAASLASNDVVALLAAACDLMVRCGIPPQQARLSLTRLAEGAIAAVRRRGPAGGLTGPVARNDAGTLIRQLAVLGSADPAAAAAHRALSIRLTGLAEASGRISRADARALRRLLTV